MTTAQVNRAGIARTFQNIRLFGDLTVAENLMVAMNDSMRYSLVGNTALSPVRPGGAYRPGTGRGAAGERHHPQGLSGRIKRKNTENHHCRGYFLSVAMVVFEIILAQKKEWEGA